MENYADFEGRIADISAVIYCSVAYYEKTFAAFGNVSTVYELIYVRSGNVIFTINGRAVRVNEGQIILLTPGHVVTNGANKAGAETYMIAFKASCGFVAEDYLIANLNEFQAKHMDYIRFVAENNIAGDELSKELIRSAAELVIKMILANHIRQEKKIFISPSAEKFYKVFRYLERNSKHKLTDEIIASENGLGVSNLRRIFIQFAGTGPINILNKIRISKAMRAAFYEPSVTGVCGEIGFSSESYFCKIFKRETGKTFKEYSKEISDD